MTSIVRANQYELIDVTVARPTTLTQLNASARVNPTTVPLAAACDAEQIKHKKYDEECAHHGWKLVPFALESYGALGTSARQLLERMSAHCTDRSPSEFLAHATRVLSVALQSGNAHVALQGVTRMATQAYYHGGCCPTDVTIRSPGVNQRKRAARTFTSQMATGECMRSIFHRGYQHAAA